MEMKNDVTFGEILKLAQMKREIPDQYKELMDDINGVMKDLIDSAFELNDYVEEKTNDDQH